MATFRPLTASLLQSMRSTDYATVSISIHEGWLRLVHFDPSIASLFPRVAVPSAVRCCTVFLLLFFECGHPCFRNFNSTFPVDVIRVQSFVDIMISFSSFRNFLSLSF